MFVAMERPVRSLYAHVPFCAKKCSYCAFYSGAAEGDLVNRFISALIRELKVVAESLRPRTIFFGGGTPSLLNVRQWERIFAAMSELGLDGAEEWTIESNPATVSVEKARLWRSAGVTRVSMGVQSLNASLLERLGRVHTRDMVFKSFDNLREAGFENINVDLMFGIPGQTMGMWTDTLREALALETEHVSCYEVIYEEDTPLYEDYANGRVHVDEDLICGMYEQLLERAAAHGFVQYEVANFARHHRTTKQVETVEDRGHETASSENLEPSLACRHNINYWRGGAYYGVGPSAAGYVQGVRTKNLANTEAYCARLEKGKRALEWSEVLPAIRRAGEIAAFGLRMNTGWGYDEFKNLTGFDLRGHWQSDMDKLVQLGWAEQITERFRLNDQGMRFADAAAQYFLR